MNRHESNIMSIRDVFRRVIGRSSEAPISSVETAENRHSTIDRRQAAAWLAAFEAGCLSPPQDLHDPGGWDNLARLMFSTG
jgi:hypothetical protein